PSCRSRRCAPDTARRANGRSAGSRGTPRERSRSWLRRDGTVSAPARRAGSREPDNSQPPPTFFHLSRGPTPGAPIQSRPSCLSWPSRLKGDIPVFFGRVLYPFGVEVAQRGDQLAAGLARLDHFVEKSAACGDVRVRELLAELVHLFGAHRRRIPGSVELALIQNVDRTVRPHHGELGGRPGVVEVGPDLLARHHALRSPLPLAPHHAHLP